MNRLKNKECLKCGTPLIRMDGVPVCTSCEEELGRMYRIQKEGLGKPFKHIKRLRFNVHGKPMSFEKAKRMLTEP